MDLSITGDWLFVAIVVLTGLLILLLIVWEVRRLKTGTRKMELEIEREKLEILKKDMAAKVHPFTRLSSEQLTALRALEDENETLEIEIYAKEKMVETRLRKLENTVKRAKLDGMLKRIDEEEQVI